jgi:hypothetical protein
MTRSAEIRSTVPTSNSGGQPSDPWCASCRATPGSRGWASVSKSISLGLAVLALWGLAVQASRSQPQPAASAERVLQAGQGKQWLKGNLHTHSLWSDGDDFLENIALWYRDHGYQFVSFTDHNVLANTERWIDVAKARSGTPAFEKLQRIWPNQFEERMQDGKHQVRLKTFAEVQSLVQQDDEFLMIQGEEISDKFGSLPLHLNAHHLNEVLPPRGGDSVLQVLQRNVEAVQQARERSGLPTMVHVNHPNFGWGITAEDLWPVEGENFFEVYNGHPGVRNSGDEQHVSTERMWDIVLTQRLTESDLPFMWGLATDDCHQYHNMPSRASEPGRGWVMVLADRLTPETVIEALEAGAFYSSSGVLLDRIASSTSGLDVTVHAEPGLTYQIEFIGTRSGFDRHHEPVRDEQGNELPVTRRYSPELGAVLATVTGSQGSYRFQGDELYVRARVTSSRVHPNPSEPGEFERAWVQPVRGPGVPTAVSAK